MVAAVRRAFKLHRTVYTFEMNTTFLMRAKLPDEEWHESTCEKQLERILNTNPKLRVLSAFPWEGFVGDDHVCKLTVILEEVDA